MLIIRKIIIFLFILASPSFVLASLSSFIITGACSAGQVTVLKMSATSNAHAGLSSSSYPISVCVDGVFGLSDSCFGTFETVLKLSGSTNAHGRQGGQADYPSATNTCLSVPLGGSISVGYQVGNCSGFDTTLASMSQFPTNAHVGDANAYLNKICASANEPPIVAQQLGSVVWPSLPSSNSSASMVPITISESVISSPKSLLLEEISNLTNLLEEEVFLITNTREENSNLSSAIIPTLLNEPIINVNSNEISEINLQEEISPNRGFLATAFAAIDFPPQDFLDWSLWTTLLIVILFSLRALWRVFKKIRTK